MHISRRNSGLMLMDAMVGMTILGMLLGVLAVAISQQQHASSKQHSQRRLDRLAEGVLTDLQQGKAPTAAAWEVESEPTYAVSASADNLGPCEGWAWVTVTAHYERQVSSIVGAVPTHSLVLIGGTP